MAEGNSRHTMLGVVCTLYVTKWDDPLPALSTIVWMQGPCPASWLKGGVNYSAETIISTSGCGVSRETKVDAQSKHVLTRPYEDTLTGRDFLGNSAVLGLV